MNYLSSIVLFKGKIPLTTQAHLEKTLCETASLTLCYLSIQFVNAWCFYRTSRAHMYCSVQIHLPSAMNNPTKNSVPEQNQI